MALLKKPGFFLIQLSMQQTNIEAKSGLRNNARLTAHPGGVAESIAEAARLKENVTNAPP